MHWDQPSSSAMYRLVNSAQTILAGEAVGAAQEWKPATGVLGLRAEGRQPGTSNGLKSKLGAVDAGDGYGPFGND